MEAEHQAHLAFFIAGRQPGEYLDAVDGLGLRPALFAGYQELNMLRYDFPLVLLGNRSDQPFAQPLSGLIDLALGEAAQGGESERIRKHVLRLEQEIRTLVSGGAGGMLSALWDQAAARLAPGAEPSFGDSLRRARAAIKTDGEVADCDAALPARLLRHAWNSAQQRKATAFRKNLDRLILKLSEILKSDFERSEAGRSAKHLKESFGAAHGNVFDFDAMSRMLAKALPKEAFPESRRRRIRELLAVLDSQQFFPSPAADAKKSGAAQPYSFLFESCAGALEAFRGRMPKLIELAQAVAIAELEIEGLYNASRHDALFGEFGANGLDPQDLAAFPDYLVCVNAGNLSALDLARLFEVVSSGLPIKVLLQTDDILEESPIGESLSGLRGRQLATMAIGLNEVYVLQSSGSNLFQLHDRILKGLTYRGPALFSVFSGASGKTGLPPYLTAAAAMESRAFPAFSYDPSAGPDWASRFSLDTNSQVERDWPTQGFSYEDEEHQRISEDLAFTFADFAAGDHRYAKYFARVPRAQWSGNLIPVAESLTREKSELPDKVPSLLMVDGDNLLQKVIVDQRLMREVRRCREAWRSLQELGGVHNSHAEKLLARERKAWEERLRQEAEARTPAATAAAPAAPVASAPAAAPPAEPQRSPDEAYIETARCSTCNECTQINGKMFAYDANQQAYIADINAGTYAQLVQAAESCQVSVIHPGKPRNPQEPGLEELLKRAEPFL